MKTNAILKAFSILWICILAYITFFSNNTYLNMAIFFLGIMVTFCGVAYAFDKLEKEEKK